MTLDPAMCLRLAGFTSQAASHSDDARVPGWVAGTFDAITGQLVAAADLHDQHEQAKRDILLQAARLRALESELATLKESVVDALSSAGPEVPEDERSA